jgi:drug/metabolite transporter (DMT)-like permease
VTQTVLYKENRLLGISLSCAGYSAWVVGDTFVKLAGQTLPLLEILAINFFVSSLFTVLLAAMHGGIRQLATKRPKFHVLRSIFIAGATYGSFAGILRLSLADFYTIIFTSPLILTILASFILREKADRGTWLAIVFGFLGVVVAVQFSSLSGHIISWQGVLATTVASLCLGFTMLTARSAGNENNYALTIWPQVINCLISMIILFIFGTTVASPAGVIFAILSGVLGGTGLVLTNASLRVAPVAVVSPYHYIQIIGGAVVGYLIWHNVPTLPVVVGATMIVASGLYVLHAEQGRSKADSIANVRTPEKISK